jgi:hypothetical protein
MRSPYLPHNSQIQAFPPKPTQARRQARSPNIHSERITSLRRYRPKMATSTPAQDIHTSDLKEEVEMDELKAGQQDQPDHTQIDLVSSYASMPRTPAIRKFWRLFLMGVLVTSAGLYSGYTTSLPGAIVGNKGESKKPFRFGDSAP